jgi:hypothetical protein
LPVSHASNTSSFTPTNKKTGQPHRPKKTMKTTSWNILLPPPPPRPQPQPSPPQNQPGPPPGGTFLGHHPPPPGDGDGHEKQTTILRQRQQKRRRSQHDERGSRTRSINDNDARPHDTGRRHRSASPPPPPEGTERTARRKKTDVASSNAKAGHFANTPTTTQHPLLPTMPPPCNQQQRPAGQQPQPSTSNVYNFQPTPNVPTVPFGTSGTSMGAVPKAADMFRVKAAVITPRQEYRQGDQTRPQGKTLRHDLTKRSSILGSHPCRVCLASSSIRKAFGGILFPSLHFP